MIWTTVKHKGHSHHASPGVIEYSHIELERGPSLVVGIGFGVSHQAIVMASTPSVFESLGRAFSLDRIALEGLPVLAVYGIASTVYRHNDPILGIAPLLSPERIVWRGDNGCDALATP